MRIISFSADGIKDATEKGFFDWLKEQDADFICIQDLQCSEYDLKDKIFFPAEYNPYFLDVLPTLIWKFAISRLIMKI
jgi:exodeoxyribonuclease III